MNPPALETYEDLKLVLLTPWGTTALALAVAVALLALGLSYWSYRRHPAGPRMLLTLLRALAVAAVLLLVLQPAVQLRSVARRPNHVAVLVDLSRSMNLRDSPDVPSRLERARALLARSRDRLARWGARRVVAGHGFGSALRSLPLYDRSGEPAPMQARDDATRIRAALVGLRRAHRGNDLAGVVLISDGTDNGIFGRGGGIFGRGGGIFGRGGGIFGRGGGVFGRGSGPGAPGAEAGAGGAGLSPSARRFLERFGAPVHTVWIGGKSLRDLAVTEVRADDFAFVRNAVKIEAELLISGLPVREVTVSLRQGERLLTEKRLALRPQQQRYRVAFEFVPQRVGKHVFSVSAPVLPGEALASNNSRRFLIKVIRDRIRVLQISGRPSWDQRFLRRLLKRDPNVDLISFFILRTLASLSSVPPRELSLIPFPTEELFERELGSFDLVILQNFNFGPYGIGVYLPHLRRYVEQGGGLAMVGGDLSFSSGGYAGTAIARVLPLRLPAPGGDPSRLLIDGDFRPQLTARGREHPILQLGRSREETRRLLAGLPPLSGVNRVGGPLRGATVLATHPRLRTERGRPMPVLAVREVGKGRSLALTTDSLWGWAFAALDRPQVASRRGYDGFWRNAIRWLIRDPELKYLRVIAQRSTVQLGGSIEAVIRAFNPDYSPAKGLAVSYEVAPLAGGGAGLARSGKTDAAGELRIVYKPIATGPHRLVARATIGGRAMAARELVLVDPAGPELRDPRATPQMLQQISAITGGRYLGPATSLPELKLLPPRVVRVNWRKDVELWSRWWWFAGALLLLALEWLVRRRYGHL